MYVRDFINTSIKKSEDLSAINQRMVFAALLASCVSSTVQLVVRHLWHIHDGPAAGAVVIFCQDHRYVGCHVLLVPRRSGAAPVVGLGAKGRAGQKECITMRRKQHTRMRGSLRDSKLAKSTTRTTATTTATSIYVELTAATLIYLHEWG